MWVCRELKLLVLQLFMKMFENHIESVMGGVINEVRNLAPKMFIFDKMPLSYY